MRSGEIGESQVAKEVLNEDLRDAFQLITKDDRRNSSYTIDQKLFAIGLMEASRRDYEGKLVPHFRGVSRTLDIPNQTLQYWYKKREEIQAQAYAVIDTLPKGIAMSLTIELKYIVNTLHDRIEEMSDTNLIRYFSQVVTKMRLLQNKSTNNISIKAQYTPPH